MRNADEASETNQNGRRRGNVRDGTWLMGGRVFQLLLNFPVGFINAWLLGPGLLGALKLIETIDGYAIRSDLGLTKAYAREIPILAGKGDRQNASIVRNLVFTESLLSTLLVIAGLWVAYGAGWRMGGALNSVSVMLLTSGMLLSSRLVMFQGKHLTAEGHFVLQSRVQASMAFLRPLIVIPLVAAFRLPGALAAIILINAGQFLLVQRYAPIRVAWMVDWFHTRRLLRIGLSLFLVNFGGMVFWSVEIVLLPMFVTLQATGLFAFALTAINTARIIPQSLHTVFFRNMALDRGEQGKENPAFLRRRLAAPMAGYVLLSALCLGAAYFVYWAVVRLFLPQYAEALPLLLLLAFGMMLYQSRVFGGFVLNLMDAFNTLLLIQAAVVVVNLAVDVILIRQHGLWGAGVGAAISFALAGFLFTFQAVRKVHEKGVWRGVTVFSKVLIASAISSAFLYFVPQFLDTYLWVSGSVDVLTYFRYATTLLLCLAAYAVWCTTAFVLIFWRENLQAQIRSVVMELLTYLRRFLGRNLRSELPARAPIR